MTDEFCLEPRVTISVDLTTLLACSDQLCLVLKWSPSQDLPCACAVISTERIGQASTGWRGPLGQRERAKLWFICYIISLYGAYVTRLRYNLPTTVPNTLVPIMLLCTIRKCLRVGACTYIHTVLTLTKDKRILVYHSHFRRSEEKPQTGSFGQSISNSHPWGSAHCHTTHLGRRRRTRARRVRRFTPSQRCSCRTAKVGVFMCYVGVCPVHAPRTGGT